MSTHSNQRPGDRQLAKRRKACGLTQHDAARMSGVPVGKIAFAETGRVQLEDAEREKLLALFRQVARKNLAVVA